MEKQAAETKLRLEQAIQENLKLSQAIEKEGAGRRQLETKVSARTLSSEQINKIRSTLNSTNFLPMLIVEANGGDEPATYADQIAKAFAVYGMSVTRTNGYYNAIPANYKIILKCSDDSVVARALASAGIIFERIASAETAVFLQINSKPVP